MRLVASILLAADAVALAACGTSEDDEVIADRRAAGVVADGCDAAVSSAVVERARERPEWLSAA